MDAKSFSFKNMGGIDRLIRLSVAVALVVLYFTGTISGLFAAIAIVLTLTSIVGSCPLYLPFGLSTLRKKISK